MKTSIVLVLASLVVSGCASTLAEAPRAAKPASAPVAGAPTSCVTVQRGRAGEVSDARIAEAWPNDNYGSSAAAFTGVVGKGERRTLLRFGMPEIPAGARITKATITLHRTTCSCAPLNVYRATADWREGEVTWSSFGEAFDQRALLTVPAGARQGDDPGVLSFDATELVRAWRDGSAPDHGLVISQANAATAFATSEADELEDRPRLEVCFDAGGR